MKRIALVLFFSLLWSGLAAAASPSYEALAKLPVIRFGEKVPGGDYILLFPAGQPVTFSVLMSGSLFEAPVNADLTVKPVRDIMIYREWASVDGMVWLPRGDLIRSDVQANIPGYNHPYPGELKVKMDLSRR